MTSEFGARPLSRSSFTRGSELATYSTCVSEFSWAWMARIASRRAWVRLTTVMRDGRAERGSRPIKIQRDGDCGSAPTQVKHLARLLGQKLLEGLARGDGIGRPRPKPATVLRQAGGLTTELRVIVHLLEQVAASFEEVDLVGCDQSPALMCTALDSLHYVAISLWLSVEGQIAAREVDASKSELGGPARKEPRRGRLSGRHADESQGFRVDLLTLMSFHRVALGGSGPIQAATEALWAGSR